MKRWMITVTILATVWVACGACSAEKTATNECNAVKTECGVVKATLNGLEITIDADTGSIVGLKHPDVGTFLETSADKASIIDVAYPIRDYPPLRLASRSSKGAKITKTKDSVTISWPQLGRSKALDFVKTSGKVSATVTLKAAPDGKSVIMSCSVDNQSDIAVKQVLFPDLMGLLPFAGVAETKFTCGAFSIAPFQTLKDSDEKPSKFYANRNWAYYAGGGYEYGDLLEDSIQTMILDWMDVGSNKGGFSIYPKRWGYDSRPTAMLHLDQQTNKLRMLSEHRVTVEPGTKWQSAEHWLTPHKYGWAEGIKSYDKWAKSHFDRKYPVPDHVKKGLGYRTIFMCTSTAWAGEVIDQPIIENDKDVFYKYSDIPAVAKEAKEHGIDELNLWVWGSPWRSKRGLELPLETTFPAMGTIKELSAAVKECKAMGVNVNLFLSIQVIEEAMASRYGIEIDKKLNWSYHPDMVPEFNPYYRLSKGSCYIDTSKEHWRKDVLAYINALAKLGMPSVTWDTYREDTPKPNKPNVYTLSDEIRSIATMYDPESTFGGESIKNLELESEYLDYTWNWKGYGDFQPVTSVFAAPRFNINIDTFPREVLLGFIDNLYLNVMPTLHGSVNGTDSIANNPSLSKTLKQCAKLRKQFIDYFVSGRMIGHCLLTEPPKPSFRVSSYVLPDSVLMIVLNRWGDSSKNIYECDLSNWLKSASGKYEVKVYDSSGKLIRTEAIDGAIWKVESAVPKALDMEIYEFTAK